MIISKNVIFNQNIGWKWSSNKETTQFEDALEEEPDLILANSTNSSPSTSIGNSPASSPNSSVKGFSLSSLDESSDETPPGKFESLREIYESCNIAFVV